MAPWHGQWDRAGKQEAPLNHTVGTLGRGARPECGKEGEGSFVRGTGTWGAGRDITVRAPCQPDALPGAPGATAGPEETGPGPPTTTVPSWPTPRRQLPPECCGPRREDPHEPPQAPVAAWLQLSPTHLPCPVGPGPGQRGVGREQEVRSGPEGGTRAQTRRHDGGPVSLELAEPSPHGEPGAGTGPQAAGPGAEAAAHALHGHKDEREPRLSVSLQSRSFLISGGAFRTLRQRKSPPHFTQQSRQHRRARGPVRSKFNDCAPEEGRALPSDPAAARPYSWCPSSAAAPGPWHGRAPPHSSSAAGRSRWL